MHIFIDESGTFAPPASDPSISAVGALVVPDGILPGIERKYARLREGLPRHNDEVKGRLLNEHEINNVVRMLRRHQVLFEVEAIDMAVHTASIIAAHQAAQAEALTAHITDRHHPNIREMVLGLRRQLEAMPSQLYIQSVLTFSLIGDVLRHSTLFYAQRIPPELGNFHWIVDAKGKDHITAWEKWWTEVVGPMLQWHSFKDPLGTLEGADYSHFDRYHTKLSGHLKQYVDDPENDSATNLRLILEESFRFSSDPDPGLELVDILVNATRRALNGSLEAHGWSAIPTLMVHRPHQYIGVSGLAEDVYATPRPYLPVLSHFKTGGKSMLTRRFLDAAKR
jgi:hypothetical protein